jgi:hypothetical protein
MPRELTRLESVHLPHVLRPPRLAPPAIPRPAPKQPMTNSRRSKRCMNINLTDNGIRTENRLVKPSTRASRTHFFLRLIAVRGRHRQFFSS